MSKEAKSFLTAAAVATGATLLSYIIWRCLSNEGANEVARHWLFPFSMASGVVYGIILLAGVIGSFGPARAAVLLAIGINMVGTACVAFRVTDNSIFLVTAFMLGVSCTVAALMKDLDERITPRHWLLLPAAQIGLLMAVIGR